MFVHINHRGEILVAFTRRDDSDEYQASNSRHVAEVVDLPDLLDALRRIVEPKTDRRKPE